MLFTSQKVRGLECAMACGHRLRVIHKTEDAVFPNTDPPSCRPVKNIFNSTKNKAQVLQQSCCPALVHVQNRKIPPTIYNQIDLQKKLLLAESNLKSNNSCIQVNVHVKTLRWTFYIRLRVDILVTGYQGLVTPKLCPTYSSCFPVSQVPHFSSSPPPPPPNLPFFSVLTSFSIPLSYCGIILWRGHNKGSSC